MQYFFQCDLYRTRTLSIALDSLQRGQFLIEGEKGGWFLKDNRRGGGFDLFKLLEDE